MIWRKQEMRVETRDNLRGGVGTLRFTNLVEPDECLGKINFCALIDIEPGQSVGVHGHNPDAEIYYMLKGRLSVTDNGEETFLNEGDSMFVGNGGTHSAKNDGDQTATLLAVLLP